MTLFFGGLILAILLPFQYVSLRGSQWDAWGGRGACHPKVPFPSTPSREGPEPEAHNLPSCPAPPGTCPGLVGSVSKPTRRPFLAGLGTCLLHMPHPASPFPRLWRVGGCHGAFKPLAREEARGLHGATSPKGALRKGPLGVLGDQPSPERQTQPARQVGVGEVSPECTPTPLEHPRGQPGLSSFTSVQHALGNQLELTAQGSVTVPGAQAAAHGEGGRLRGLRFKPREPRDEAVGPLLRARCLHPPPAFLGTWLPIAPFLPVGSSHPQPPPHIPSSQPQPPGRWLPLQDSGIDSGISLAVPRILLVKGRARDGLGPSVSRIEGTGRGPRASKNRLLTQVRLLGCLYFQKYSGGRPYRGDS